MAIPITARRQSSILNAHLKELREMHEALLLNEKIVGTTLGAIVFKSLRKQRYGTQKIRS